MTRTLSFIVLASLCLGGLVVVADGVSKTPLDLPTGLRPAGNSTPEQAPSSITMFSQEYTANTFVFCINNDFWMANSCAFELLRPELITAIRSLGADAQFNVVTFSTETQSWKTKPVAASTANKQSAIDWIQNLTAVGVGDFSAGPLAALESIQQSNLQSRHVILVGRGPVANMDESLGLMAGANQDDVKVSTIYIGTDQFLGEFFTNIAQQNDGTYCNIAFPIGAGGD